jgi:hypothetical protein
MGRSEERDKIRLLLRACFSTIPRYAVPCDATGRQEL